MTRFRFAVVCCFCMLLLATTGQAQGRRNFVLLGTAHVDGGHDHDNIKVGRGEGPFREIQLRVRGGAIEFQRVVVHYGNGGSDEIPVRAVIRGGGQTRAIDLRGERRNINSVELWYAKAHWKQRPMVELYGR
jgi:hypothetical protein